ncbi:ABC transporter permease [Anaerotignum lactatifermentans]|nr:ABC transporter permease subunit [Anaerotignum lactatifermentans]
MKIWAVLFWLAVWQAASMWIGQEILLVSPAAALYRLFFLAREGSFWQSVAFSAVRILGGFFLALLAGILTGALAARYRNFRHLMAPLVMAMKSTPVASFVILALFWFSASGLSVFISFLIAFPLVYGNTWQSIVLTDQKLLEMGQVFHLSFWKKIRYLYFPQLYPNLQIASALGMGMCWKAGTAAEVIGVADGSIGERLYEAKAYLQMPDLFAWTITIIVVSIVLERLFLALLGWIERKNRGGVA